MEAKWLRRRSALRDVLLLAVVFGSASASLSSKAGAANGDAPPDFETRAAVRALNDVRRATGVREVVASPALTASAQAHSRYMALNGYWLSHSETPGRPGFTGVGPSDRARAAGYPGGAGEVITAGHSAALAVEDFLASVYHRVILLSPDILDIGFGGTGHAVIDIGYDWQKTDAAARYPVPGAADVPPLWVDNEMPDPMGDLRGPFGYPITLELSAYYGAPKITLQSARVEGPSGPIGIKADTYGDRSMYAVPTSPLQSSATYRVTFTYVADGAEKSDSWSFTTASDVVHPPTGLWLETGDFGRIVHWSPPSSGPPPAAYELTRCSGFCITPETITLGPDQLYWADPQPQSPATIMVASYLHGVSAIADFGVPGSPASRPYFSSKWVSQSPYPTLSPGEVTTLEFDFRNTGTVPWVRGVWGQQANLGLNGDNKAAYDLGMNVGWLWDDRIATTDAPVVDPDEVGVFRFELRAPKTPGVYRFSVRPVIDGTAWMQDDGVFLTVTVR